MPVIVKKRPSHSIVAQIPTLGQVTFSEEYVEIQKKSERMNNFINNALSNKTAQVITSQYNNEIAILKNL